MLVGPVRSVIRYAGSFESISKDSSLATRDELSNPKFPNAENLAGDRAGSACLFVKLFRVASNSIYEKHVFFIFTHISIVF